MSETEFVSLRFDAQDPAAVFDYRITYEDTLAEMPADVTVASVSWSVVPITGDLTPLVVVASTLGLDADGIQYSDVRLSGGTLHNEYRVRALVTFSDGQVQPMSFMLEIGYT
jgi:hypothetical protein